MSITTSLAYYKHVRLYTTHNEDKSASSILPITQKYVTNAIIKSVIVNNPHGSRHIHTDNWYVATYILEIIESNYNLMEAGTCRADKKGLTLNSYCWIIFLRGTFKIFVHKNLDMVITRHK